jgi:hypothetical protein
MIREITVIVRISHSHHKSYPLYTQGVSEAENGGALNPGDLHLQNADTNRQLMHMHFHKQLRNTFQK